MRSSVAAQPMMALVLLLPVAPARAYAIPAEGTALENDLKVRPFWSEPDWARWSAQFLSALVP